MRLNAKIQTSTKPNHGTVSTENESAECLGAKTTECVCLGKQRLTLLAELCRRGFFSYTEQTFPSFDVKIFSIFLRWDFEEFLEKICMKMWRFFYCIMQENIGCGHSHLELKLGVWTLSLIICFFFFKIIQIFVIYFKLFRGCK